MADKEVTRICDKCHKEVVEANFALHESHCWRFLCLCPDCDEPVPKELLQQHRLDEHTQVKCSKCKKKVERCHLMDHESDECVERLQCCEYCQVEVPWRSLDEHSVACGSRTELCEDCGRYVTLKDQLGHAQTCPDTQTALVPDAIGAPDKRQMSVICIRCMKSFPAEDLDEHQLECASTSRGYLEEAEGELEEEKKEEEEEEEEEEQEEEEEDGGDRSREASTTLLSSLKAASLSGRPSREPGVDGDGEADPDQIGTCPHCHLALPLVTLRWHEAKCRIHISLK